MADKDRETAVDENEQASADESMTDEFVEVPVEKQDDAGLPTHRDLSQEEMEQFRGLIEAVVFLSPEPLSVNHLARRVNLDRVNVRILADTLVDDYAERDGGILLREIAGGYQFITSDRYSQSLRVMLQGEKKETLSRAALETLAIICYRQPITLPEIEDIRGANSRAMVTLLMSKKLVKPQGYRPVPGRPTLYVTTRQFLSYFALNSLADLPVLEDIKELKFDDLE